MANIHKPRKGTLQFWPRKRAKRIYPRIKNWPKVDATKLLGFAGYKVGMTHASILDNSNSTTKNLVINCPVTVIECPPLKTFSLRFYKKIDYKMQLISEVFNKNVDKELLRRVKLSKKDNKESNEFDELRLVVYTQPKLVGIGKKKPEIFEIKLANNDVEYAKQLFDKEIRIKDVFKEGQQIDVHAVTKGKGYSGTIKRFGLKLKRHKSEKHKRAAGNLGAWTPSKVAFSAPQPGQMGFHTRVEYNKWLLKIDNDGSKINPKGGFLNYGLIKSDYIILKGSVPGPVKRLIRLKEPTRPSRKIPTNVEIKYISLSSKQGN